MNANNVIPEKNTEVIMNTNNVIPVKIWLLLVNFDKFAFINYQRDQS